VPCTWAPTITPQPSTAVPTPYYDGEFHTSASLRMAVAAWFEDRAAADINEWPKAGWLSVISSRRYALIRIVELVRHVDRVLV